MQSLNRLDTMIYRLLGKVRPVPGDVGIELEIEGHIKPIDTTTYWTFHDEGSLRGGVEFVLKKPVDLKNLPGALGVLKECLDKSKPVNSLRCSTHIHVNVSEKSARQIYQFLIVYYLLEPLLIRSQPKKRWANLFCLDMEHAQEVFHELKRDITGSKSPFKIFNRDHHRYAACNLVSIQKFGSIEFRFLDAFTDVTQIFKWSQTLHRLVDVASSMSPLQVLKMYDELSVVEFIQHFLGQGSELVLGSFTANQLNRLIYINYDSVFELAHILHNRKFEMPKEYWEEDAETKSSGSVYLESIAAWPSTAMEDLASAAMEDLVAEHFANIHPPIQASAPPPPPPITGSPWTSVFADEVAIEDETETEEEGF